MIWNRYPYHSALQMLQESLESYIVYTGQLLDFRVYYWVHKKDKYKEKENGLDRMKLCLNLTSDQTDQPIYHIYTLYLSVIRVSESSQFASKDLKLLKNL